LLGAFRQLTVAILLAGNVAILAISSATAAPSVGATAARFHPLFPSGHGHTVTSLNWSGYAITAATDTGVTATWVVPTVTAPPTSAYSSTWVGIGGYNSQDLIQAGTEQDVLGNGSTRYYAWWEILPFPENPISMAVHPGDTMQVTVRTVSGGKSSSWEIFIKNKTTGASFTKKLTYSSSFSSAEWIEEAPTVNGQIAPLADFGTVTFNNSQAGYNGHVVSISGGPYTAIDIQDPHGQKAAPGPLSNNGETFSDTWGA
jgi:hypothetical protein